MIVNESYAVDFNGKLYCNMAIINIFKNEGEEMDNNACNKCGSDNINFQREQSGSFGGSLHSFGGNKSGHGIIWWVFIGWWYVFFKWVWKIGLAFATMGLSLLFRRREAKKVKGSTISATKTFNRTVAVCQSCGNTWKV